jgi:hypothetical protein
MEQAGWSVIHHYTEADGPPNAIQVWRAMYDAWVPPPAPACGEVVYQPPQSLIDAQRNAPAAPDHAALVARLREQPTGTMVAEFKDMRDPLRLKAAARIEQQAARIAELERAVGVLDVAQLCAKQAATQAERELKRALAEAAMLRSQVAAADDRAEQAEALATTLTQLLRESQDSIGGDWRARRDAAIEAGKGEVQCGR